jgi:hypothetical protein
MKTVSVTRSNMTIMIKRVTHTKNILNLSLMVLLSNGSNSWMTSTSSFGLDNNGPVCFNLTCSSLKGEALYVFNNKRQ